MKKVWVYKLPDRKGYRVGWYENGRQRTKSLPTKALADHFAKIKYQQLNSDVFLSAVDVRWPDACAEFLLRYDTKGLAESTKYQAEMFLTRFTEICMPVSTKSVTQQMVDRYLIKRQQDNITNHTVNKDIGRLKTLLNWLKEMKYHAGGIKVDKLPTRPSKIRALEDDQICNLVAAATTTEWKLRIVFGLCTGLRKEDLYRLPMCDVNLNQAWVKTTQAKTGKEYSGPIPDALIPYLRQYLKNRQNHRNQKPDADKYFFRVTATKWLDKAFREFRPGNETIQSLRKTYSTRIESTGISTEMLGHASKSVTKRFYNDMDYIKWIRVNQLPVMEWLKAAGIE